jgi:outer membrane receptor protein involved in Fe transport
VQYGRTLVGDETLRRQINTRFTFDPHLKYLTDKNNLHQYRGRIMRVSNKNDTGQDNSNWMFYNNYQFLTHLWQNRLTWVSGVTLQYNTIDGDSLFGGDHWSFNGAVYTQFDGNINERLKGSLGARFDYFDIDGDTTEMSPIFRAGLNYKVGEGTNIRASFGQAFRSPSIAERFTSTSAGGLLVAPNPGLKVEKGYSAEIGFRQGFMFGNKKKGAIGFLDLAGFVMDFRNMIEFGINGTTTNNPFDPDFAPIFSAVNISRATIPGVELTGLASITLNKFTIDLSGGITYLNPFNPDAVPDSVQVDLYNTEGPNAIQELFAWLEPEGSPNKKYDNPEFLKYRSKWTHVATLSLGYGKFSLTTNFRAQSQIVNVDQVLYLAINGAREWRRDHDKGYKLFDFVAGYDIMNGMNVSLLVKNAFNEEYVLLPGIMEKQRQYAVQFKYVF